MFTHPLVTYPLAATLSSPCRTEEGGAKVTGPPGVYTVFDSVDLATWSELGVTTNALARSVFIDATVAPSERKFYRARFAPLSVSPGRPAGG